MTQKIKVAILGSGNIGTDLMIKVMRHSEVLEMGALVGIDPESDGLARAKRLKVATTHEGLDGLTKMDIGMRLISSSTPHLRVHINIITRFACAIKSKWLTSLQPRLVLTAFLS